MTANTVSPEPDPSPIVDLAVAYRRSMVMFAANELDLFTVLSEGAHTTAQLADRSAVQHRPLEALLNACVAQGLLQRDGDQYHNAPHSEAFLVKGRPAYMGDGLKYSADLYPAWGRLGELLRTNRPPVEADTMLGADPDKTRNFVMAMHNRALGFGAVLPHGADLTGRRHMLDVGGGPGTYSILSVQETPGLRATVLDLPGVLEITKEIIASYQCEDRVTVMPGDYTTTDFGSGYDVMLQSGMMHRETPEVCRLLLSKGFAALDPGGRIVVSDVFFDDDQKDGPPFVTHFAINMMLTSRHGSAHAKTEMARWMEEVGFTDVRVKPLPPPNPHTLVLGAKPKGV